MRPTHADFDPVHHALADIPAAFRDEAMASRWNHSSTLILNNGGQLSTPHRAQDRFAPVHQLAQFPVSLSKWEKKERPEAKRDWIRAEFRDKKYRQFFNRLGVQPKWLSLSPQNSPLWLNALKTAVSENESIKDNNFDSFREFNFKSCGSSKSWGWEVRYNNDSRFVIFSCGETDCCVCYDRDKRRTARRYLNKIIAAAKAQGIDRFWTFVFTLPEELEASIPKGSIMRKALLHEIKKFERKLFGFKTEDGLFAYANVHAVGDSNLMRDRFHVHSGVLPIAIRRVKKQPQLIKSAIRGIIDVKAARALLADHLEKVFPEINRQLIQFNAKYISLTSKKGVKQLAHRLNYDLRGFGKDIEQAPILFDPTNNLVLLDGGKDRYGIFTIQQVAERWQWIRKQRDLRSWGLLNQWNKYSELLDVEHNKDPEPKVIEERPITIKRTFGRKWIKERCQINWVDEKRVFRMTGEEIHQIEWGRKGSEGEWQPRSCKGLRRHDQISNPMEKKQ